jgi:hypothetical protein
MKKKVSALMFALVAVLALTVPAFASTPTYNMPDVGASFSTALGGMWTNILEMVTIVLPAGLAILGISLVIGLGRKFIRMFVK